MYGLTRAFIAAAGTQNRYHKVTTTLARRMSQPFLAVNPLGDQAGPAGSFLVQGAGTCMCLWEPRRPLRRRVPTALSVCFVEGEQYVVDPAVFVDSYQRKPRRNSAVDVHVDGCARATYANKLCVIIHVCGPCGRSTDWKSV